uniref:Uncharacterized protein n=1 Tax=Sinocyclocheilus grahami TaxID=75366 RepID=A0A672NF80_SINGR
MDPSNFMNVLKLLSKSNIKLAGPLLALLVGLQILMDVKFSCPCLVGWNTAISVLIFFVPVPIAIVIILLFFKLRAQGTSGTSQAQGKCGTEWNCTTVVICLVPFVVWLCLCLIDGDYIACAATDWNGNKSTQYAQHIRSESAVVGIHSFCDCICTIGGFA